MLPGGRPQKRQKGRRHPAELQPSWASAREPTPAEDTSRAALGRDRAHNRREGTKFRRRQFGRFSTKASGALKTGAFKHKEGSSRQDRDFRMQIPLYKRGSSVHCKGSSHRPALPGDPSIRVDVPVHAVSGRRQRRRAPRAHGLRLAGIDYTGRPRASSATGPPNDTSGTLNGARAALNGGTRGLVPPARGGHPQRVQSSVTSGGGRKSFEGGTPRAGTALNDDLRNARGGSYKTIRGPMKKFESGGQTAKGDRPRVSHD